MLVLAALASFAMVPATRAAQAHGRSSIESEEPTEYEVKGEFLLRFATFYVKWPESAFSDKTAPFVVAILGKDPFGKALDERWAGKKVGEHPIRLVRFDSVEALKTCHMLFVPQASEKQLEKIREFYRDKPVLIVAESIAAAQSGAHIGFYLEKLRLRFAINPTAAKAVKLEISSELLKLAKIVEHKSERDQ